MSVVAVRVCFRPEQSLSIGSLGDFGARLRSMKQALKYFLTLLVGIFLGAFANSRLTNHLYKDLYDSREASALGQTIITASQLRSGKSQKTLSDLDAIIELGLNDLQRGTNKSPHVQFTTKLAKSYFQSHRIPVPNNSTGLLGTTEPLTAAELQAIEDQDRRQLVQEHLRQPQDR